MFNSPVLDLILLLSFTYFIGSLILSAVNESIAGALRNRQNLLQDALEGLFFDPAWKTFVTNRLLQSPHIESLMKKSGRYPAYIPTKNFLLAIIEQLGPNATANLPAAINSSPLPAPAKQVLLDFVTEANGNFDRFKENITTFFNNAMDRASGWYKKDIRRKLLFLGILLSIILNIDTIGLINESLQDKKQLEATADRISASLKDIQSDSSQITILGQNKDTLYHQTLALTYDSTQVSANQKLKQAEALVKNYEAVAGYKLGYAGQGGFIKAWFGSDANTGGDRVILFLCKLLGILITGFALQINANYWFDLMNKVANVRAVGKKPNGHQA